MAESGRAAVITSVVFVLSFVAGLALVAELAGSVGETDETFVEHFSSDSRRVGEIVGALLLVVAALAFLYFTQLIVAAGSGAPDQQAAWGFVRGTGMLVTVALVIAAMALVTVPLSINLGNLYDESAFGEGQAVLPQFGHAVLTIGAMWPAAVMITAVAVLGLLPTWLTRLSYAIAVLLVVTSVMVGSLFILLPVWVALTAGALRRAAKASTAESVAADDLAQ